MIFNVFKLIPDLIDHVCKYENIYQNEHKLKYKYIIKNINNFSAFVNKSNKEIFDSSDWYEYEVRFYNKKTIRFVEKSYSRIIPSIRILKIIKHKKL